MKSEFRSNVKVEKCMMIMFIKACWFKKNKFKCQQIEPPSGSWIKFPTPTTKSSKYVNPSSKFSGYTTALGVGVPQLPASNKSLQKPRFCCLRDRRSDRRPCDEKNWSGLKLDFSSYYFMLLSFQPPWNLQVVAILFMKHIFAVFLFASDIPRKWRAGFHLFD